MNLVKVNVLLYVLIALSGCDDRDRYIINCDSDFTTGNVPFALIDKGVIRWRDDGDNWISRKMIQGEACQVRTIKKIK